MTTYLSRTNARAWLAASLIAVGAFAPLPARATDARDEVRKLEAFRASAAHFESAAAAARRGDADEARRDYLRAIELDPGFVEAMVNLARLSLDPANGAPDLDDARRWIERAARTRPDYPKVPATQALLAAHEGDSARALGAIERAYRLAPDDVEIATNYGALLIERGRHAQAHKVLEAALRRAPDDALATFNLALADDLAGRADRAAYGYQRFLALSGERDPKRAEVRERLDLLLGTAPAAPAPTDVSTPAARGDVAAISVSEVSSGAGAPSPESEGGMDR